MTTQLKCDECSEMFEVSNEIAEAMHRWRAQSGEPFLCGKCAGVEASNPKLTTDNHQNRGGNHAKRANRF